MATYLSLHYHVVFATKNRVACLDAVWRDRLFHYMGGTVRGLGAFPQGTGGWNDHVHLLFGMRADKTLSDVVREIKKASSVWIRDEIRLNGFAWQEGYGAFTVGYREREIVRSYIADQEQHHHKKSYEEEVAGFYQDAGVEFDPRYLA